MKGKNLVKVPGELYAPTPGGVVTSADGIKDYRLGKMQETINKEVVDTANEAKEIAEQAANSASSMENIVQVLREQGEQDIATALDQEARIQSNTTEVNKLKGQLGNLNLVCISEDDYEELVANGELDNNTIYFTAEEEQQ